MSDDASDSAVRVVLQQFIDGHRCPVAFFSRNLNTAETKYSTFDCELLTIYLAVKHFCHFVEGREFHILTDHKPITFALATKSANLNPRQSRHLDYISQFIFDICFTKCCNNPITDAFHMWRSILSTQTQLLILTQWLQLNRLILCFRVIVHH